MCCWLFYSLVIRPLRDDFHLYTVAQLFSLDEFTIGVWKGVSHIQDPSLVLLASSLPRVVLNAKARNTTVRYAYGWNRWNRWKTWCKSKIGVTYIPAQPMFVALYLRHLLNSAKTISPIDTAVYSIRWGHSLPSLPSPTEHPLVQSTYEGCKQILARPRAPKDPFQPSHARKVDSETRARYRISGGSASSTYRPRGV